jgi:hypothetical protein
VTQGRAPASAPSTVASACGSHQKMLQLLAARTMSLRPAPTRPIACSAMERAIRQAAARGRIPLWRLAHRTISPAQPRRSLCSTRALVMSSWRFLSSTGLRPSACAHRRTLVPTPRQKIHHHATSFPPPTSTPLRDPAGRSTRPIQPLPQF